MDRALIEMVRGALEWLTNHEIDPDDLDSWDFPLDRPGMPPDLQHAIGFVCGVAAGLDLTPRELIWSLPEVQATVTKPKKRRAPRARKAS